MQILRQLDVHPKVREEADILVRTFSGAVGKMFYLSTLKRVQLIGFILLLLTIKQFSSFSGVIIMPKNFKIILFYNLKHYFKIL